MGLIFKISLRNLLRQKKRNSLLGLGIAFGMMILVIANSFSHGMVDILINDITADSSGQLAVEATPGKHGYSMIRDRQRLEDLVKATIKPQDFKGMEEKLAVFARAVGNKAADNVVIVGVAVRDARERKAIFQDFYTLVAGNFDDFFSQQVEYPVIISRQRAESLNVKVNDVIRVRVPMVTGQIQAAKLTVIAIANPNNSFMDIVIAMNSEQVKKLLGYKPWETAGLKIKLANPKKNAPYYADLIHQKLTPKPISIVGKLEGEDCQLLAYKNTSQAKKTLQKTVRLIAGDWRKASGKKGVLLSSDLAQKLQVKAGEVLTYRYPTKFRGPYEAQFKVDAVFTSTTKLGQATLLVNEERIHDTFGRYLPAQSKLAELAAGDPLSQLLATEWKLLERSADSEALKKKYRRERQTKTDQIKLDVVTMYESASDILKLEGVLNLVTVVAILVLFFIILIGVVNALRMTIKERIREIGTVQAIGMQKTDVRNMFVLETLQLTFIACLAGVILGLVVMGLLGSIRLDVNNALNVILKDKHLYFKVNPWGLVVNFGLVMLIAVVTAYFPARRAARLTVVEALRHYE